MLQAATAFGPSTEPFFVDRGPDLSTLPPAALRVEVAKCVADNCLEEAERMLTDGLRRFPDSEDLLVMRALMCEVQLDWPLADLTLQRLLSIQGRQAPVASWLHWVRVLRCMQQPERAIESVQMALRHHPQDASLLTQAAELGVQVPPKNREAA